MTDKWTVFDEQDDIQVLKGPLRRPGAIYRLPLTTSKNYVVMELDDMADELYYLFIDKPRIEVSDEVDIWGIADNLSNKGTLNVLLKGEITFYGDDEFLWTDSRISVEMPPALVQGWEVGNKVTLTPEQRKEIINLNSGGFINWGLGEVLDDGETCRTLSTEEVREIFDEEYVREEALWARLKLKCNKRVLAVLPPKNQVTPEAALVANLIPILTPAHPVLLAKELDRAHLENMMKVSNQHTELKRLCEKYPDLLEESTLNGAREILEICRKLGKQLYRYGGECK